MTKVQIRIAVMLLHILFRITFFLKQFGQCLMFNNTKKVEGDRGGGDYAKKRIFKCSSLGIPLLSKVKDYILKCIPILNSVFTENRRAT